MKLNLRQLCILVPIILILLSGLAGTLSATSYNWTGGGNTTSWNNDDNWSGIGIPGAGDDVHFLSGGPYTVGLDQSISISNFETGSNSTVTIISDYTLSVSGTVTIGSGSALYLEPATAIPALSLQLQNLSLSGILDASPSSGSRVLNVSINGSLSMGPIATSYIGRKVSTSITNANAITSDVRFEGMLTFDSGDHRIPLGNFDLFLGEFAGISVPAVSSSDPKGYIATSRDSVNVTGGICKHYGSLLNTPFEFPVGGNASADKFTPIRVEIRDQVAGASSTQEPWPYVKVRAVSYAHPMNTAQNQFRLYWSVKGFGTPDVLGGSVCLAVEMYYHNFYRTGSPSDIFSACYTDNYEDDRLESSTRWSGIWDLNGSQYASNNLPAGSTTFQSNANYWLPMGPNALNPGIACVPHFGDFTVGLGTEALPVELYSFSARYVDQTVRLSWNTATELNNFGFAIERSTDGEEWEEVGFVQGFGTSSSPKSYSHVDKLTEELTRVPQLAYRLRQIDRDGTTDYSNIVFVKTGEIPANVQLYAAYPNPFNPATTISFALKQSAGVTLTVYNTFGQEVARLLNGNMMDAGLHTVPFNGDQLPSGVYMAVLESNGTLQHQKLVLNK